LAIELHEFSAKGAFPIKEYVRDVVNGELTLEYFARKFSEGWKVAGIDWVRENSREASDAVTAPLKSANVLGEQASLPFGFRVTESGLVEENPLEATVLLLILEQIIRERRIQEIATALNEQGYLTREGTSWTATDVFNLLPRVVEAGPSILKSTPWRQRRPATTAPSAPTN
jgi:Recombinase